MAMLILFSNMYGFLFKEWSGADKHPKRVLHLGMLFIVIACVLIGYGNYRGESEAKPANAATARTVATGH
jgi:L-rhamnose-H+ transport protein